jgi:hypothetical protein
MIKKQRKTYNVIVKRRKTRIKYVGKPNKGIN